MARKKELTTEELSANMKAAIADMVVKAKEAV